VEPIGWRVLVVVGFLLGQGVLIYTFYETQKMTRQIEMIRLAKELSADFYVKDGTYRELRNAIESCQPLYKSWGGRFDHDDINRYLGFFEDIGYYTRSGFLSKDIVGHLYGAYIIEAYEYPEIKRYVALLRKNAAQPTAFEQFEKLAMELEADPRFVELAKGVREMCKGVKPGSGG
jgi:hypothetical protein